MLSNEYYEGQQFARRNGSLYSNPYPMGTNEYNDFDRGWSQEHKLNPGAIAHADRLREKRNPKKYKRESVPIKCSSDSYKKAKDGY